MFIKIDKIFFIPLLVLGFALSDLSYADDPEVKKSNNAICHAKGTAYYSRTKNYTPYTSMEACLKDGGRRPKK